MRLLAVLPLVPASNLSPAPRFESQALIDAVFTGDAGEPAVAKIPRKLVGRYRIVRRLGKGGYGVVYLGDDEELSRQVDRPADLLHAVLV